MANEEQLTILRQGVKVWNQWRSGHLGVHVDLSRADLNGADLSTADLGGSYLDVADLRAAFLKRANLSEADLSQANLSEANLSEANLCRADLSGADLKGANLSETNLCRADLRGVDLRETDLRDAILSGAHFIGNNFSKARMGGTIFGNSDLSTAAALENVIHIAPSRISTDTLVYSKGKIPEIFLRGCGLSDWEIEFSKLYVPDLSFDEINKIQNRIFDLRNRQALQISSLFISYSHVDGIFVERLERNLAKIGIRFWRDIHDLKSGRIEMQVDRAIHQNPTVLLILSKNALKSDWVQHEIRIARELEKGIGRDVLCPVALDDSWKSSRWPKRVMEQIMEYNILDFSDWKDDAKFDGIFRKLIDGLELFYKG